jgi:2-keto-4-pentenoate hydratase
MGIELEVCYLIKKTFFNLNQKVTKNNMKKFITHIAPCIEVVGYRQKKKGIKSLGDLCSDFGANVKFVVGPKKKYKNQNVKNLKTNISNKKINQSVYGNTNTVYIDPLNSLRFVLSKLQKDKIKFNKNFYVFTGSSVGVVPILGKGIYNAKIDKIGSVSTKII